MRSLRLTYKKFCAPKNAFLWLFVLTILLLMGTCQRSEEVDEFAQLKERFQAELDKICAEAGFPGATAAFILADGQTAGFATGLADKDENIPMTPETRMSSGSVGKTYVAAVAISLAHEGRLSLDDKIATWFGEEDWFSRLPNGPDITLRMLLTHSSGLKDHVYDERFHQALQEKISPPVADPDFRFPPLEFVKLVLDQEPLFPAGEGYAYTDTGYILIGMIIEKATGSEYYKELRKRILDPLNLSRTIPANRRDFEGLANGHLQTENPLGLPERTLQDGVMLFNPANEWTGGGLITNPQDLVRWAKLLYEEKALDKPYLEELLKFGFRGESAERTYGLGVGVRETEFGPAYGHGGWFPGYRTSMVYYPDHKIAVAIQINTDYKVDLDQYVKKLTDVVLGKLE
ncbi:serine hydrolase domain-containing protein [Acidobacteriota bacterium]